MIPLDAVSGDVDIVSSRALKCDDIKNLICEKKLFVKEQQPTFRPKSIYKDLYGVIGV